MRLNFIHRQYSDVSVGAKLVLDAGGAFTTMKEFKKELRQAKEDLLNIQHTFGATSKEAFEAAKKVAQFEDALKEASETAKLFDPGNKFQVLGNTIRGIVGGFTALQGTLALVGVEGENVQAMLLKVQSALALTEGLNVIADVGKDFQRLGSILVQTFGKSGLVGIAIAGVAALTAYVVTLVNTNKDLEAAQKEYGRATVDATKQVYEMRNAFDQARKGLISKDEALKKYNQGIGETVGQAKNLNEAEKLLAENADNYIKVQGLKAKANFILQKSAELSAETELARLEMQNSSFKNVEFVVNTFEKKFAEAEKKAKDYLKLVDGINDEIKAASAGFNAPAQTVATPRAATAKAENKQIEYDYSTHAEQMLLRQQELQAKFKENRNLFIEEGQAAEQADFDEKIRLLNLEMDAEENAARLKIALAEQERQARVTAAQDIGNALGALSELVGRQTAAGKALGIAQAAINMWIGVSEVLRAKSVIPEPFGTIAKIANVATVVATGLNAIKNIAKVQVPGGGGGGAGSLSASAPLTPQPQVATTQLDQRQLNQIGNATVRAFVVESDVANNRERVERLNRAARLG